MIYGQVLATISLAIVSCLSGQALAAPTQDTFESAGLVLHYQISGQGSPVVILAGGPGFGASYMQPVVAIVRPFRLGRSPSQTDERTRCLSGKQLTASCLVSQISTQIPQR